MTGDALQSQCHVHASDACIDWLDVLALGDLVELTRERSYKRGWVTHFLHEQAARLGGAP